YRNKMEFSFNVDTSEERGFTLGLHERGRFDKIFDLDHCHLQSKAASTVVGWTREFIREKRIPVYDVFEHTGFMRFLMIRQSKRTSDLMVNLVTNYGDFPHRERYVAGLREAVPQVSTIVHNQNGQKSNIATGEIEKILYGRGFIEECLFESRFRINSNAFFQTNTIQTETLYRTGFDLLEPQKNERVLDLYCGTGSIGILVAPYVEEVVGVELVADAIAVAKENAALNEIKNINFFEGNVKDYLKSIDPTQPPFDVVIIDPPRAGLHPKALKRMLQLTPKRILYISCNPSTFARDARSIVDAGYERSVVKPIDMFPHTRHIELVTVFKRN
ncbi:MAG: 23S rRNA (uracil(1939)-C(5))-methyltransferase RlmD, partial [bacterium]|nr:23S rRNA (uracil(1939)-C(5))-methyltransferase RlmD [bacterium]